MTRAGPLRRGVAAVVVYLALAVCPAMAGQTCLPAPYSGGSDDLATLVARLQQVLGSYPSLSVAMSTEAPDLCLDDNLFEEQGYFEPKSNRIVLRQNLAPDMQLAVALHEMRHVEQFSRAVCPTVDLKLVDYVRSRQALEADAAAISLLVAWDLQAAGDPGPWAALAAWPTHDDLTVRFGAEMGDSGDPARAAAAAYSAWFDDPERREIYAFVSCVNYLDALDRENLEPGKATISSTFLSNLCRLPDGQRYDCFLPP